MVQGNDIPSSQAKAGQCAIGLPRAKVGAREARLRVEPGRKHFATALVAMQLLLAKPALQAEHATGASAARTVETLDERHTAKRERRTGF